MTDKEIEQLHADNLNLKAELDAAWSQVRELEKKYDSLHRTASEARVASESTVSDLKRELEFLKGKVKAYEHVFSTVRFGGWR